MQSLIKGIGGESMSERESHITIEGMTCNKCSNRVKRALELIDGVRVAEVDFNSGVATVHYQEEKLTTQDLKKAISSAGYKAL